MTAPKLFSQYHKSHTSTRCRGGSRTAPTAPILSLSGWGGEGRVRVLRYCLFSLLFLLLFFGSDQQAIAQEGSESLPVHYEELLKQVKNNSTVMVIVGLDLPIHFRAEGELANRQAIQTQRSAIVQSQRRLLDNLSENDVQAYAEYESIPYMALQVDEAGLKKLVDSPLVSSIQEDVPVPATLLDSTLIVGAPAVWAAAHEGADQAVVILDTGIDADHSFFGERVITEACFSNAGGGGNGVTLCPNEEVSQIGHGAANVKIAACNGGSLCNHGTHVAGIAAGNGPDFDGVSRGADIIAIQVFTRFQGPICGGSTCILSFVSDQLRALEYIQTALLPNYNIAAINMSLGGGEFTDQEECDTSNSALKVAIDNLRSMNVATVIAAANNGYTNALGAPSCISSAIAVSSTTKSDNMSSFSNMHDMVELLAPGSDIQSSVVGGGFATSSGTSIAAPHVTGAWAVLKSIKPTATVDEVLTVLEETGVPITDTRTISDTIAHDIIIKPRIQLDLAAEAIKKLTPQTLFHAERIETGILLTWQTSTEINQEGFNLYRNTGENFEHADLLNPDLIQSQDTDKEQGFFYEVLDTEIETNTTYYYWLEQVESNDTITLLGPIHPLVRPTAITLSQLDVQPTPADVPVALMLLGLVGTIAFIGQREKVAHPENGPHPLTPSPNFGRGGI